MRVDLARPLAASLLFGAILTLVGVSLAASWADLSAAEAERDAKATFVSHSLDAARRSAALGATGESVPLFVVADSETLAAAAIDALLRSLASETGGSVLSSRAEAKHDETGLAGRIEVQTVIEADNDDLQQILLKIESGAPMMMVDALAIQAANGSGDVAGATSLRLQAAMTLSAYWKPPVK